MTGEGRRGSASEVAVLLLYDAAEMLNDRPNFALRRDATRTSYALVAEIERFIDDLRIRHDAVLSVLPDLTARIYLAHRDEQLSYAAITKRFELSVVEVERRIADALFALTGIGLVTTGISRND